MGVFAIDPLNPIESDTDFIAICFGISVKPINDNWAAANGAQTNRNAALTPMRLALIFLLS